MMDNPETLYTIRFVLPAVLLAFFFTWESWRPFFEFKSGRVRHGLANVGLTILNALTLGICFGVVTVTWANYVSLQSWGLLNIVELTGWGHLFAAFVLFDGWMYCWHRANHVVPFLWRFHRMHHTDDKMDVTSATRFHFGELAISSVLRLVLILVIGLHIWEIVFLELVVLVATQFHHANISLGKLDAWVRLLVVSPDMHKVHHSNLQPETDSNFSTVLSIWDRVAQTFKMRDRPETIQFGLTEFAEPKWQTIVGMLKTPFMTPDVTRNQDDETF